MRGVLSCAATALFVAACGSPKLPGSSQPLVGADGQADAGSPDAGPPDAGTTAQTAACVPSAPPTCDPSVRPTPRPITCRASLVPAEPVDPKDAVTVPLACDERVFGSNGALASHSSAEFDAQGRPVVTSVYDESGAVVRMTSTTYDDCGDVLSRETRDPATVIESLAAEYGADGLVRRMVGTSNGRCNDQSYAYRFDDKGHVTTIYDPYSCKTMVELSYDEAGRVGRVQWFDISGMFLDPGPVSVRTYTYHPNGVLKEVQWTSAYGYHSDHQYDDQGRPVDFDTNQTGGSTIDDLHRQWTYDGAGRLSEYRQQFDGMVRCASRLSSTTYDYDAAGNLVRMTEHSTGGASICPDYPVNVERVTAYAHPTPFVTVAELLDEKGAPVDRTTRTLDESGREIRKTYAEAPDLTREVAVWQRDYSCLRPNGR